MKPKQRDRWSCFIGSRKARAEKPGKAGKMLPEKLGWVVVSWKEMRLEAESRVKLLSCWLSAGGWRVGHPLLDPQLFT